MKAVDFVRELGRGSKQVELTAVSKMSSRLGSNREETIDEMKRLATLRGGIMAPHSVTRARGRNGEGGEAIASTP